MGWDLGDRNALADTADHFLEGIFSTIIVLPAIKAPYDTWFGALREMLRPLLSYGLCAQTAPLLPPERPRRIAV